MGTADIAKVKLESVTNVEQVTGIKFFLTWRRFAVIVHLNFVDKLKSIPEWYAKTCTSTNEKIASCKPFMGMEKLYSPIPYPLVIAGRPATGHITSVFYPVACSRINCKSLFTLIGVIIKIDVYIIRARFK